MRFVYLLIKLQKQLNETIVKMDSLKTKPKKFQRFIQLLDDYTTIAMAVNGAFIIWLLQLKVVSEFLF